MVAVSTFATGLRLLVIFSSALGLCGWAQAPSGQEQQSEMQSLESSERPLPDVATLMRKVEANQRTSEALLKDYLYHQSEIDEQTDGHGGVKKTESREYDIFWINRR